jgi:Flp pilus assembly protein TadG
LADSDMNATWQASNSFKNSARQPHATRVGNLPPQSGQALVELALVVPMLLLLALGIIEIGRYAYVAILVGNAARAGAAFGSQSHAQAGQSANISAAANNDFQSNGQSLSTLGVTSDFSCGCDSGGTVTPSPAGTNATCFLAGANNCAGGGHWVVYVSVTATGTFNSLFNYPGIPSSIVVIRTVQMRVRD